jgi:hypothetical protein
MSKQLELCAWLGEATKGLPDRIKALVYDELTAHYEDALAEAQLHGAGMAEAHQTALAQLGNARVTCRALRDTHLAHRRYSLAAAVSLFSLVMLLLGAFFTTILPLLFFILSIICTIYLLRSLKRLIEPILPIPRLRYSIALLLRNSLALNIITLLIIICGTARQALFALLFFRAASPHYDRRAHA